jgi:hypothetical protein
MLLADSLLWRRLAIVGGVLLATWILARWVDRRIARRDLRPEAMTRYRILRRSITAAIMFVVLGGGRDRGRLRVAADARELRRGHPDRVHPARPAR